MIKELALDPHFTRACTPHERRMSAIDVNMAERIIRERMFNVDVTLIDWTSATRERKIMVYVRDFDND